MCIISSQYQEKISAFVWLHERLTERYKRIIVPPLPEKSAVSTGLLAKAFTDLGSRSELLSFKLQKQAQELLMNFEEPLKEYVRTVQSIKVVINDRAQA